VVAVALDDEWDLAAVLLEESSCGG